MKYIEREIICICVLSLLICAQVRNKSAFAQDALTNIAVINTSPVIFAKWNPKRDYVATISEDSSQISLWDMTTYELTESLDDQGASLIALDWSPNGQLIAALSSTQFMNLWDTTTGDNILSVDLPTEIELPDGYSTGVTAIDWQPNGDQIAIGINYGVAIFTLSTGDISIYYDENPNFGIVGVAWSPDGTRLAVTSYSGDLAVLNPDGFRKLTQFANTEPVKNPNPYMLSKYIGPQSLDWDSSGNLIATIDYACFDAQLQPKGYALFIADTSTKNSFPTSCEHQAIIYSVAWNPTGTILATGSEDGIILIWNTEDFEPSDRLEGHTDIVTTVSWNSEGDKLVSGSLDGTLRIWEWR